MSEVIASVSARENPMPTKATCHKRVYKPLPPDICTYHPPVISSSASTPIFPSVTRHRPHRRHKCLSSHVSSPLTTSPTPPTSSCPATTVPPSSSSSVPSVPLVPSHRDHHHHHHHFIHVTGHLHQGVGGYTLFYFYFIFISTFMF